MSSKADMQTMSAAEKQSKAELELKIRKRVALEEKAHRVVERLLDNPIEPDFLCDCAKFITPDHYEDVTEERAVSQLCGYPICQNYIKDVPKQKYHISTRTNTVYDIAERKNFCCNQCFKASNYYKKQIPVSPVWAREMEPAPHVILLDDKANKGSMGNVVFNNPTTEIRQELDDLEEIDKLTEKNTTKESSDDVAVIDDLTETFQNQMNQLQEDEVSASEVTTEKELSDRLAEEFLLNDDEKDDVESEKNTPSSEGITSNEVNSISSDSMMVCSGAVENSEIPSKLNTEKNTPSGEGATSNEVNSISSESMTVCSGAVENSKIPSKLNTEKYLNKYDNIGSKTDRLMQLLDKRDALQEKLKTEKDKLKTSDQLTSIESANHGSLNEVTGEKSHNVRSGSVMQNIKRFEEQDKLDLDSDDEITEHNENNDCGVPMVMPSCVKAIKETSIAQNSTSASNSFSPPIQSSKPKQTVTPLQFIRQTLVEWKTKATVIYLTTEQKKETGYEVSGKTVDAYQIDDDLDDNVEGQSETTVPGFKQLEKETVKFDLKVKEYLKGKMTRPTEVERKAKEVLDIEENETPSREVVLPLVDSYSQVALRRRIVLDKLNRILPDLLGPMGLVLQDVAADMRQFVHTFNLSSTNITMKPAEWTLMAFFLLKILSKRIRPLQKGMEDETAANFFRILISGLDISEKDIQSIMMLMT